MSRMSARILRFKADGGGRPGESRGLEDPQQPEPFQDRPAREHQDEGEQVQPQRQGPQQRQRRQVDGKVRRDAHQQRRGRQRQRQPLQAAERRDRRLETVRQGAPFSARGAFPVAPAAAGSAAGSAAATGGLRRQPDSRRADREEGREQAVAGRPPARLQGQRHVRFDQQRIGRQAGEAAEIAGRVEEIRIFRRPPAALREPSLQQRCAGRNAEKRQPHADCQQHQEPRNGVALARRCPAVGHADRQTDAGHAQQPDVQQGLPPRAATSARGARRRSRPSRRSDRTPGTCSRPQAIRPAGAAPSWRT